MQSIETPECAGHEQVLLVQDESAGYRAIIALHSTRLGPATGGTRLLPYATEAAALTDALSLSRAMTYKAALAGLHAGGGKSVIMAPPSILSRSALFRAHGRAVESLGGRYVTALDVGTTTQDLAAIASETEFVSLHRLTGGANGGDTARGVYRAMLGAALLAWGAHELRGARVAIQGCGNVGAHLAQYLAEAGADVLVCDVDASRASAVSLQTGARAMPVNDFMALDVDIVAPCALGGVLTNESVKSMKARIVAGGANNQLASPVVAQRLMDRTVLYVPDYVANAGGMIAGVGEREGMNKLEIQARIDAIRETTIHILALAAGAGESPVVAADRLAEKIVRAGRPTSLRVPLPSRSRVPGASRHSPS